MVKKIRLIEDEKPELDPDEKEYQEKMLEVQQAIDWKLWEMLKIAQAWAEREGLVEPEVKEPGKNSKMPVVKPIIVDEDE